MISAEKYGVPRRRQRLVLVARKGEDPPAHFPPAPTHAIHVNAGEAIIMGCDRREGRATTGALLETARMRAMMTREQVGAMGYRPTNAYCVMGLREPIWTLTSSFTRPSGGKYVVVSEGEDHYMCLSIKEGAALYSFDGAYHFCGTKTEIKRMVGNAVPPKLAEAVARSIGDAQFLGTPE